MQRECPLSFSSFFFFFLRFFFLSSVYFFLLYFFFFFFLRGLCDSHLEAVGIGLERWRREKTAHSACAVDDGRASHRKGCVYLYMYIGVCLSVWMDGWMDGSLVFCDAERHTVAPASTPVERLFVVPRPLL